MNNPLRVLIWNEYRHEKRNETVRAIYPQGIHGAIAEGFAGATDVIVKTATLDEPEQGLSEQAVASTDVLVWWGHTAHREVQDAVVDRVQKRVLEGMGLVVLHSGHFSRIFKRLMGTNCSLMWRDENEKQRIWTIEPGHPIAAGLPEHFELDHEEMYGERFDVPPPDEVVFLGWFQGGEVFRTGCCWQRGHGRVFYFQPGHETYPTYHNANVLKVIANAVRWAAPRVMLPDALRNVPALEPLSQTR
ncbi:MAG: ThuA domain-containing protein [Phycisphaeraceae bacterium]|nr:ThuA domain-containing protein [Phycisphaeraceae bacterium]